ncbi:homoserine kinase [Amorphus orientalis]|uniref:Homoserine kinase n=1 Tax=Amorphus orientalis TaxID=649198 RepID=A0AAE4AUW5_9HYPH|nr:homoserine kinase [Amorphus orientalis]MDQ0316154.1 homoserine kinase type II [Amorphus orientalis]
MAVYTEVSDDDLARFIADFDLGAVLSSKGIAEGVENTNYLIRTERGPFILTLYEKRVERRDLPFFLGLMQHLSARGVPCPTPVETRSGALLSELAGRPAAIITFLEGMWRRRPEPYHCAELGRALATMHAASADFGMTRPNTLGVNAWRPLFAESANSAGEVLPGLAEEVAHSLDRLEANWPEDLPVGTIHADLFPDNVFFLGRKLSGLIDFYFACTDALAYDVAICLNAWCFEPDLAFNITKARALLSGYSEIRPFTDAEFDALPLLAEGAAMRFLLTRLHDWLRVPAGALVTPKDPAEYLRRVRFHQGITSASDYGLDR